jgi:hypothetical protein
MFLESEEKVRKNGSRKVETLKKGSGKVWTVLKTSRKVRTVSLKLIWESEDSVFKKDLGK